MNHSSSLWLFKNSPHGSIASHFSSELPVNPQGVWPGALLIPADCASWVCYLSHLKGALIRSNLRCISPSVHSSPGGLISLPSSPPVLFIHLTLKVREVPPFLNVWPCVCVCLKVRPPQQSWGHICFRLIIIYRSVWFETLQLFPFHEIHTLATWWEELTHWERPWCWERLGAGEGGSRRWDGWMVSLTQWTWVWANSGRQWKTGKTGVLESMGLQRVGHNLATEQQQHEILRWALCWYLAN